MDQQGEMAMEQGLAVPALNSHSPHRAFTRALMGICLLYLACQVVYLSYTTFSADDFWLAFHTYQFRHQLPYRDFVPYKTVLGYYVLLLPMLFTHGVLQPLLAIKLFYALINCAFLWVGATYLKKFFAPAAVLTSVVLLVFSQVFLSYSCEIRVDLLAYWFCLLTLLLVMDNKFVWAGVCLGVAFLVSQKALCYLLAVNCGVLLTDPKGKWRELLVMNGVFAALIGGYLVLWSGFASLYDVMKSVFYDAYVIAALDNYDDSRGIFLKLFIQNNFLLVALLPVACLSLLVSAGNPAPRAQRYFIFIVTLCVIVAVWNYKQGFSYNKLILYPCLFLTFAAFFNWLLMVFQQRIPRLVMLSLLLCVGTAVPMTRFLVLAENGDYQKSMVKLADSLLAANDNYLAGTPVFYDKPLTVRGLRHLTAPALEWLYQPTEKNRGGLLSSLLLDPVSINNVLQDLEKAPVKLYINNSRMQALPPTIQQYLASQYHHYWGSIYLYAPMVAAGKNSCLVKFSGNYKVESPAVVVMDGKSILPGAIISIAKGSHVFQAANPFRLHLVPATTKLDARYGNDDYAKIF
jgi:hypothetical protein